MTPRRKNLLFWAVIVIIAHIVRAIFDNWFFTIIALLITVYALFKVLKFDGSLRYRK
ncbi:hypothetical protein [Loigolactobacillus rennini]|uniref:Uncharacterized protein n=2 Tax=Loigolactobacillus rennini TaxID=238013 RepID=A0A0R2D9E9_9LACO|nr:hypothetical protein [Loigolactobacillus rennini]KRM97211.1 hypothetical protein FC24_GL001659 [Loigolactobacillus rennini DSM 20253]SFZ88529.1 hypothetical protein LREN565_1642 [Loigolactobacillus rennini]